MLALSGCGSAPAAQAPVLPSSTPQRTVQAGATSSRSLGTATTYDTALVPVGARVAVSSESGPDGTVALRGPDDEIRLDLLTDEQGAGGAAVTVPWGRGRAWPA